MQNRNPWVQIPEVQPGARGLGCGLAREVGLGSDQCRFMTGKCRQKHSKIIEPIYICNESKKKYVYMCAHDGSSWLLVGLL